MRQLTFLGSRRVEWRDIPEPSLQTPLDALVRPIAVANCDLDREIISGAVALEGPFAMGHEFVAEVVAVGDGVYERTVGERVVVPFQISCGKCARCVRGMTASCLAVSRGSAYGLGSLGRGEWGGALSDLVRVPFADAMLVPIGDLPPAQVASVSDNLPDAYRSIAPALLEHPGARVLIVGGGFGSIALYACGIAVALGCGSVHLVDPVEERRQVAVKLGASVMENRESVGRDRFPVVVNCSSDAAGLDFALRNVEPGGICTNCSIYFDPVPLPLLDMYTTGVTLRTGRADARTNIPEVLNLIREGRLSPEVVTTRVGDWDEAPEALLDLPTKLVLVRE